MIKNVFFVYCFLDTRKIGKYIFNDYEFNYEPIYIGKGKGIRPQRHFTLCKKSNTRFHNRIKSIINDGYKPEIIYLENNLSEIDAFKKECFFIELIGRIENGGTLTNLTDGGDGQSGFKFSENSKLKMSLSRTGEKNPLYNKHHSSETKLKISISKKGKSSRLKGIPLKEETKIKMSFKAKERIGERNSMFGKHHKIESIEKMKNRPKKFGKDNPNYHKEYTEDQKTSDDWKITDKNNNILIIKNLTKYCKENNLNSTCMRDVYYGRQKTHKNWIKVEKLTNKVKKKKV